MSSAREYEYLTVEADGAVATVWLDRPDALNALAQSMWSDLPEAMETVAADDEIRVVVIAGRGRAFTSGIDLKAFGPMLGSDTPDVATRGALYSKIKEMQHTFSAIAECPKPVIAAIHGYCLGAGVSLITACDIRLAAADAVISVRETKLGFVADVGATQRLPRIVGAGATAELLFSGRDVTADEALQIGLVNHVYPDVAKLHKAVGEMAAAIAANSPLAVQGAKHMLRIGETRSTNEALDYMAVWNANYLNSEDTREAMLAYLEKRDPEFKGR